MTFTCDLFEEYKEMKKPSKYEWKYILITYRFGKYQDRRSSNTAKNGFLYDFDLSDVNSSKYRYFQKV